MSTGKGASGRGFTVRERVLRGVAFVAGLTIANALPAARDDPSLRTAIIILSVFILIELGVDLQTPFGAGWKEKQLYESIAATMIGASGIILGLLAVFGQNTLTTTAKVGTVSLVVDILCGLILLPLIAEEWATSSLSKLQAAVVLLVYTATEWSLAFGLLCVAMAVLYR
jgi:hypothetical protein